MAELAVVVDNVAQAQIVDAPVLAVKAGQVLVRVDKCAFTANVVSYALAGTTLGYFQFFPSCLPGHGSVPSWGVGTVVCSRAAGVRNGERLYGFFPFNEYVTLSASRVRAHELVDDGEHKKHLAQIYRTYSRIDNSSVDQLYSREHEDLVLLLRPLFLTAWLLQDHALRLAHDAGLPLRAVLTSASSKTAYALAWLLKLAAGARLGTAVVGLTSKRNVGFVRGLGCYDSVIEYGGVAAELGAGAGALTVVVDMSGDAKVVTDALQAAGTGAVSTLVGATHVDNLATSPPGRFFFAPKQAEHAIKRLGPEGFANAVARDWQAFLAYAAQHRWCVVERRSGPEAVLGTYKSAFAPTSVDPRQGVILSMWPHDTSKAPRL
jgi:hypothetical protein